MRKLRKPVTKCSKCKGRGKGTLFVDGWQHSKDNKQLTKFLYCDDCQLKYTSVYEFKYSTKEEF